MAFKGNVITTSDKLISNNLDKSFFQYTDFNVFAVWSKLWQKKSIKTFRIKSSGVE